MGDSTAPTDDLLRLLRVQQRVRELAGRNSWFGEAIRASLPAFAELCDQAEQHERALHDLEHRLARELLEGGRVYDPAVRGGAPNAFVEVRGRFPAQLVRSVRRYLSGELPAKYEGPLAAAALAVLDGRAPRRSGVEYRCDVVVALPTGWQRPLDPRSSEPEELQRLGVEDYRTVALYRLGGLADIGSTRPIVPRPVPTGDEREDFLNEFKWRQRFPTVWTDINDPQPAINPRVFPPGVADDMFAEIEAWAATRWVDAASSERAGSVASAAPPPGGAAGEVPQGATPRRERLLERLMREHRAALAEIRMEWKRADEVMASFEASGMGRETGGYEKISAGEHAAAWSLTAKALDRIVLKLLPLIGDGLRIELLGLWNTLDGKSRDCRTAWTTDLDQRLTTVGLLLEARLEELSMEGATAARPSGGDRPADPPRDDDWISSSSLKDLCGLTPDQLQKASERGKLHPEKRGRLLWYRKSEIRAVYPEDSGNL